MSAEQQAFGSRSWSPRRRALASITVGLWIAIGAAFAAGLALEDPWSLALAFPLLGLKWWMSGKWRDAERAEGAFDDLAPDSPEVDELRYELGERSERGQWLLLAEKRLERDDVVMAVRYPSRESLVVRSAAQAVEVLGLCLVGLGWPVVWLVSVGAFLWLAGGRQADSLIQRLVGRRLHRTPISSEGRSRWLRLEDRAVWAVLGPLFVVAIVRIF